MVSVYKLHKMFTNYPQGNFTQPALLKQSHMLEQNQNKILSSICKQHLMYYIQTQYGVAAN